MGSRPASKFARQKISTTIAPGSLTYLEKLIAKKEARTLAEAIDLLVERLRAAENRERLSLDTAAYFDCLSSTPPKRKQILLVRWQPAPTGWILIVSPKPRRGEIWVAHLGDAPKRHWVVIVSLDSRNLSDRASSVLVVPFGSYGAEGPTTMELPPGETGLPSSSFLKAHFVSVLEKSALIERAPRVFSGARMRQVVDMIRRAVDPDAPWSGKTGQ